MTSTVAPYLKTMMGRVLYSTPWPRFYFRNKYVITAFHRVNTATLGDGITCAPENFEDICAFLAKHFRVISLAEQIEALESGRHIRNSASITFDDGYLDNFEIAAPILRKLRLPATFFVSTDLLDSDFVPTWDHQRGTRTQWMSWHHVRELAREGFDIESHTCTHVDLGRADFDTARNELRKSFLRLANLEGSRRRLFAYPFGGTANITEKTRVLIREEGYRCCLSCHGGVNTATANVYSLSRIPVNEEYRSGQQFGLEILRASLNPSSKSPRKHDAVHSCA